MSGKILIVEDTLDEIRMLSRMLTDAGFAFRAVRDGASALRATQAVTPSVIIMDLLLPDRDGIELCRDFRKMESLRTVPIIFVSVVNNVELKAQAFEAGGDDYVTKPYNERELLIRIQHHLERVHLRAQVESNVRFDERNRIARELHDSVNQTLFILSASVQSLVLSEQMAPNAKKQLEDISLYARSALAEMRALLNELRPSHIRNIPIQQLIYQLIDAFTLRIDAEISLFITDQEPPDDIKAAFYRILQEALTNVAKHADANKLQIKLLYQDGVFTLSVEDDGLGFDPDTMMNHNTGIGLHSMRERTEQIGAQFEITSSSGQQGTRIEVSWPRRAS